MAPARRTVWLLAFTLVAGCSSPPDSRAPGAIEVHTADVHTFVKAWRQLDPADSACAPLSTYLQQGTPGLQAYRRKFDVDQAELCAAVRRSPGRYEALETKLGALDSVTPQIRAVAERFAAMHPMAHAPSVYLVVGSGVSGGSTSSGRRPMILVGMELNRSIHGLPGTIAHELVHTQQDYPFLGAMNGGPTFLRGTLLRHAIAEGSANFIAELLTGVPPRNEYGERHEAQLWVEFQRDAQSRDYRRWLYNGRDSVARGSRPPDLGYWMGYRITKSFYDQATDKEQAIREILTIRDFPRFLERSGYRGDGGAAPAPAGA